MKKLMALLLAFVMIFSFTACGGDTAPAPAPGADGGAAPTELVVIDSEWYGIDTFQLDGSAGGQSFASSTPFSWDAENSCVVDNVLQNWQVSDDLTKVTFDVPEGLTFCTGEPLLPEDVKASLEHGLKVSPYCDGYSNISSIDIDGQQITLNLDYYSCDMEYYFTADFICIIDKDELDSMSDEELMWGAHPYGPYYLPEGGYVSGSEVNLVRFDDFKCFDPRVENHGAWAFEKVKFRFNVEDFTETEEIKNGTVQLIEGLSIDQLHELETVDNVDIVEAAYPCINYFEINTDSPVFSDIRVRQALALTLNREAVADIEGHDVVPAYSIIYDTMQAFSQEAYDYFKENYCNDPEKAKQLLDEAGWVDTDGDGIREKDGQKLEFTMYSWQSYSTKFEAFGAQLAEVGFDMHIEFLEWNYIHDKVRSDEYDCGVAGLAWAEPILIFNICFYDQNAANNDDTYRDLVEAAAQEPDPEARVDKVKEAQMHIFEQCNMIPMFGDNGWTAFSSQLTGYKVMADGTIPMNDLKFA